MPKSSTMSVAAIKKHYTMMRVLRHYGWDEYNPKNNFYEWVPINCPFHDDAHASASLNARLNKFRCHACDIGGDVVDLVKEVEVLSTSEALAWITENVK